VKTRNEWTDRIMRAAGQSGDNLHKRESQLLSAAVDQVGDRVQDRLHYLANSANVGVDLRNPNK